MIKIKNLNLEGVCLLDISLHEDNRGSFIEAYTNDINNKLNIDLNWIQDNESVSNKNVFRGMHFQKGEFAQSKLIRVSNGKILDIIVDLRRKSKTFKKFITIKLESRNNLLYIPKGIAHGFLALSDKTIVNYKCDKLYNVDTEAGLNPFKSNLNIDWGIDVNKIIISKKDNNLSSLDDSYIF